MKAPFTRRTWHGHAIEDMHGEMLCQTTGEAETQFLLKLLNPAVAEADADELVGLPTLVEVRSQRPGSQLIKDGDVIPGEMVWWRARRGPERVKSTDNTHWANMREYPHLYSHVKPEVKEVYVD
jgi:hypothetical protein